LPAFPVVRPTRSPTRPDISPYCDDTRARRDMQAAFDGFRSDLPSQVAQALEWFPVYQWNLLLLIHRRPEALELVQSNPVLAWSLANCDAFRPVYGQPAVKWAKWQIGNKQIRILEWLGFPATDSTVRLLRKLEPSCIDPVSMRMIRNTLQNNTRSAKMLRHQSRINAGIHRLCCYGRLTDVPRPPS